MSRHNHAVVIGGSIAGLLAARVLADHFAQVTVLEADHLPQDGPGRRRGVPQSPHLHILLMRGQAIFEELFPGLKADLLAAGAPEVDSAQDFLWRNPFGWGVRYRSGLTKLAFTRDLLDWHVRQRLLAYSNVSVRQAQQVTGLITRGHAVAGVQLSDRAVDADLVVDASGRGSRMPRWLEASGYAPPEERIVDSHPAYASRLYAPPSSFSGDWRAVYLQAAPPERLRSGVLFSVEGNRWLLSMVGVGGDHPPTDERNFLAFTRGLASPLIYDAIREAEPLSPIALTRTGQNQLRRYDQLRRWPERLIVVGDAACAFNPVYGQGMTVASLEALALQDLLASRRSLDGLARTFQRRLAKIVAMPWSLATGEDARYPSTDGANLDTHTRLLHRYMNRVLRLATQRQDVRHTLLQVQHMLRPPTALFSPRIAINVLWQSLESPPIAHTKVQEVEAVR
jgi:2-polyprenyl-6-methoxyphenol hydroxylase-like FAD-dependent oxidoreductase